MSFKKLTLVALAVLFLLSTATLFAQQVPHFILSSTTYQVRQHGQTEVVGDITLTCDVSGTFPSPAAFTVLYSPVFGIVNSTSGFFSVASAQAFNARHAYVESEPGTSAIGIDSAALNTVTTNSITVDLHGFAAVGDIIRVMGIRVNIGEANLPAGTQVNATVIAIPPNAFQIDNTNTIPVAFVLDEIKVTVTPANPMLICFPGDCVTGSVTVAEKFPSALTTVTDENDIQHKPSSGGKSAAHGTQIIITIAGVLPGVTVEAPDSICNGDLCVAIDSTANDTCANTSTTKTATCKFTYNVTSDDLIVQEDITFDFRFCPEAIPVPPVFGTITAQAQLGPNAGTGFSGEVAGSKILSFVKNPLNTPPDPIASLSACTTNLLCKFLSTATGPVPGGGYDTGIAIANTSSDIFGDPLNGTDVNICDTPSGGCGAIRQQGACRVYLFGSGGTIAADPTTTPTYTTPVVLPGSDAIFDLKFTAGVGAGYQGYAFIQCDFQYAHAEIIIADQNFSTFSHGYDCLIVPDPLVFGIPRSPTEGGQFYRPPTGEALSQKTAHSK